MSQPTSHASSPVTAPTSSAAEHTHLGHVSGRTRGPWWSERRRLALLLGIFVLLLFIELPGTWLAEPDEARYAEIPREMLASGDYLTPRLDGAHYFEKPPLLYWANAASMRLLGENAFAARLPTRLAAIGTAAILMVELSGPALPTWGLWAALIFLSAPLSFVLGRYNITDGVLTFGLTLAFFALRRFLLERDAGRSAMGALALLGLGTGLAMLAKGLIGIAFPGLVCLLWVGLLGKWRRVRELLLSPAPVVFVLVTAPWFVLMERANPGFSRFFFIHEHFARFATSEAGRGGPIYYFVLAFIVGFLPWTVLFGHSLGALRTWRRPHLAEHRDELFFALWFFTILVFFSLSHSKLLPYILPAMPAAAALLGRAIAGAHAMRVRTPLVVHALLVTLVVVGGVGYGLRSGSLAHYDVTGLAMLGGALLLVGAWIAVRMAPRAGRSALMAAAAGWGGFYLALILALPQVSGDLSGHGIARIAQRAHAEQVVSYKWYPQILPWVLKAPIPVADYTGELGSDGERPPAIFWSGVEFWQRWASPEHLVVVVRRRNAAEFTQPGRPPVRTLGENHRYIVLSNFTPPPVAP
ncbi:MAG TPA: phospholipid carrier-dependent glycosyltransferase [Gemmatimonadaceae bacterium]|nr:phospholipid carrier-dependent glycosyltransferase [Gemmatimonadaceae bacterium]